MSFFEFSCRVRTRSVGSEGRKSWFRPISSSRAATKPPNILQMCNSASDSIRRRISTCTSAEMAQDPVFLILKFSAWRPASEADSIFGAAVKNFLSPTNNSVPDLPLTYPDYNLSENSFTDFVLKKERSRG